MKWGFFVTGTDTGCGKTEVSLGLMWALQQRGLRVLGMKPVASGCEATSAGLHNPDALRLQAQGSVSIPYAIVNPYAFELPIAPHIAARQSGTRIDLARIQDGYRHAAREADRVIVEGVGGWRVPLGPDLELSDLARALELPLILVVGLKLGCINHALITVESILRCNVLLAGWVANQMDPEMLVQTENIQSLAERIAAPYLGLVPWRESIAGADVGRCLNLDLLSP